MKLKLTVFMVTLSTPNFFSDILFFRWFLLISYSTLWPEFSPCSVPWGDLWRKSLIEFNFPCISGPQGFTFMSAHTQPLLMLFNWVLLHSLKRIQQHLPQVYKCLGFISMLYFFPLLELSFCSMLSILSWVKEKSFTFQFSYLFLCLVIKVEVIVFPPPCISELNLDNDIFEIIQVIILYSPDWELHYYTMHLDQQRVKLCSMI